MPYCLPNSVQQSNRQLNQYKPLYSDFHREVINHIQAAKPNASEGLKAFSSNGLLASNVNFILHFKVTSVWYKLSKPKSLKKKTKLNQEQRFSFLLQKSK